MTKKEQLNTKAKKSYQKLSPDAKVLVGYFCSSLRNNGYVIPDALYFNRDPKGFIENMQEAERLLKTASLKALYSTIDTCHKRRHSFWGKVPLFKFSTLTKAYNNLLANGDIKSNEKDESPYGKNDLEF